MNALGQTVSQNTADISTNAHNITLKVSSTDYTGNTIASLINQNATTIQIQASKIDLVGAVTIKDLDTTSVTPSALGAATSDDVTTAVNGIQMGGTNLITGSESSSYLSSVYIAGSTNTYATVDGIYAKFTLSSQLSNIEILSCKFFYISQTGWITESVYIKCDGTLSNVSITFFDGGHHHVTATIDNLGNNFYRISASYNTSGSARSLRINSDLSALSIRATEYLQRWKEVVQFSSKDYSDQMLAQFGIKAPEYMGNHAHYIGGWSNVININEVVNTNLDTDNSQASIAGKGVGSNSGHTITYDCGAEHQVIMCVYHAVPMLDWNLTGQAPQLTVTAISDFPQPAFDQLGMQAVPALNLQNNPGRSVSGSLGYNLRY